MVDVNLSWKKLISLIENKVAKGIGILYIMKSKLDTKSLHMIYCSLILPYIDYGCEIWGNTYNTRLEKLFLLQKKQSEIIEGLQYKDHTSKGFYNNKCLKIHDLASLKSCLYIYKAYHNLLPPK